MRQPTAQDLDSSLRAPRLPGKNLKHMHALAGVHRDDVHALWSWSPGETMGTSRFSESGGSFENCKELLAAMALAQQILELLHDQSRPQITMVVAQPVQLCEGHTIVWPHQSVCRKTAASCSNLKGQISQRTCAGREARTETQPPRLAF